MGDLWRFEALDTLFFRDGRPFTMGESGWAESQFPPAAHTTQGAIRSLVLDALGVDYADFGNGKHPELAVALGDAGGLGRLDLTGPFLTLNDGLLYPTPLDLVKTDAGYRLLTPGDAVACDLDAAKPARLPTVEGRGTKTQEGKYVNKDALERLLAGDTSSIIEAEKGKDGANLWPLFSEETDQPALADRERRIGLARNNALRQAREGMLYSIAHVRPREQVGVAMAVDNLDDKYKPTKQKGLAQRFGGEGKFAAVRLEPQPKWPAMPSLANGVGEKVRFKLVLTTPARFAPGGWLPDGFKQTDSKTLNWGGKLNGIQCEIVSACVGKAVRIGGWDLKNNKPRSLEAFVPAGSVYFCESNAAPGEIGRLHGAKLGERTQYGFGHVLVGKW